VTQNVGGIDRWLRIVIGLFGVSLIFWGPKSLWGLFGLIPLMTGLIGYCGLYPVMGLNTCKKREAKAGK
jgi:hypothetical protein